MSDLEDRLELDRRELSEPALTPPAVVAVEFSLSRSRRLSILNER